MSRRGVFPGSFNPLTIAHLEIASRARESMDLDEVHIVVSRTALDKPDPPGPSFEERIALLEADAEDIEWLHVSTTEDQLIADIAAGYDVVIMGADKWEQVNDLRYYRGEAARDDALARLPQVVVAPRSGTETPDALRLETDAAIHSVSSTEARTGNRALMAPMAAAGWRHTPTVRRCATEEVATAAEIYISSRRDNVPAIPPSVHPESDMRRWYRDELAATHDLWIALIDEQIVGVLALGDRWIEQLYVDPRWTNQGVGTALIGEAKAHFDQLDLWTFASNVGAQRFYERHGFTQIERTDGDNEEGAPDIRYRWRSA